MRLIAVSTIALVLIFTGLCEGRSSDCLVSVKECYSL